MDTNETSPDKNKSPQKNLQKNPPDDGPNRQLESSGSPTIEKFLPKAGDFPAIFKYFRGCNTDQDRSDTFHIWLEYSVLHEKLCLPADISAWYDTYKLEALKKSAEIDKRIDVFLDNKKKESLKRKSKKQKQKQKAAKQQHTPDTYTSRYEDKEDDSSMEAESADTDSGSSEDDVFTFDDNHFPRFLLMRSYGGDDFKKSQGPFFN